MVSPLTRAYLWLACLSLAVAYAVFWYGGGDPIHLAIVLLGLGVIAIVAWAPLSPAEQPPRLPADLRWLGLLLVGYVAFQVVPLPLAVVELVSPARAEIARSLGPVLSENSYATVSVLPSATVPHLIRICALILIFLIVRQLLWRWPERPWLVAAPLVAVASLEAALGLVQYFSGAPLAKGTYVNRNHYAGLLAMILPFAVMYPMAVVFRSRSRSYSAAGPALKAGAVLCLAMLILVAILFSLSRMGFVASLVSLGFIGALALRRAAWNHRRSNRLGLGIGVAVVGPLVVLSFIYLPSDVLIKRFAEISSTEAITAEGRLLLWRESIELVKDYALLGCGLGGYPSTFLKYKITAPLVTDDAAHNDYLQLLAELGIIGFSIGGLLVLAVLTRALRTATRHPATDVRCLALACVGSITAVLLHSWVDFNLYVPANVMLLAWVFGISTGLDLCPEPRSVWKKMKRPEVVEVRPQVAG